MRDIYYVEVTFKGGLLDLGLSTYAATLIQAEYYAEQMRECDYNSRIYVVKIESMEAL
jgi:hypothetical protein